MSALDDPITEFLALFAKARETETGLDPTAMTLATVGPDGRPAARVVLLKEVDERGFVFHTNYESRKGRELLADPRAALCIFWPALQVQVRVEGAAHPVDAEESEAYWTTRPRESQLGAWASQQSRPLESMEALDREVAEVTRRYLHQAVPRPPHWGGFRVAPETIEFWYGRTHRLHERVRFSRGPQGWRRERLYP